MAPTAIPTTAPVGSEFFLAAASAKPVVAAEDADELIDDEGVDEGDVEEELEADSAGNSSPGCNMNFEFLAKSFCVARIVEAFYCC